MLITLAEVHGINMAYNEKDGEMTVEQVAPVKESAQAQQQSFFACAQQHVTQIQRTPNQPPNQSDIDYVSLANADFVSQLFLGKDKRKKL